MVLKSKEGEAVPQVTFKMLGQMGMGDVTTDELFKGKKVIVFSLPGAFTPTCSSTHLPRFNELAPEFKKCGVDSIICMAVNDAFVMKSWAEDQEAENVTLIADGNGEFSEGMGMLVDKSDIGFGKRSWRYSMFVDNCIVKKMFIEPEVPGDPFKVSDADTMMKYINPEAKSLATVTLFTKIGCPFCKKAKALLTEKGYNYTELVLGKMIRMSSLRAVSGRSTVPQVFIDGKHIGGHDDLVKYFG